MFNLKSQKQKKTTFIPVRMWDEQGFALVEAIISVAIFSVVMTVGIVSLLSIVSVNKRSQAFKIVVNNLNLAIESMSKDIRVGYDYNCASATGGDCVSGGDSIYFKSKTGEDVIYRLYNHSIQRSVGGSSFVSITAEDVVIDLTKFYVIGSSKSDFVQPYVIIMIEGHTGERDRRRIDFDLQTTVTQRKLDF